MACYSPLQGWRDASGGISFSRRRGTDVDVTVACGTCIGCRIARSRMWALRIVHESKLHGRNSFVTLTYDDEHLPRHGSLKYSDVQLFHKRLRKVSPFRFFLCGEYGEQVNRPHYHACYFGYFPSDAVRLRSLDSECETYSSVQLAKTWGLGQVHVGTLTYQSAAYCSGYLFKKRYGDYGKDHYKSIDEDGVWTPIEPEFARMSLKPGIGRGWYERYAEDFHRYDVAIHEGKRFPVPKYYDRILEQRDPGRLSELQEDRELKALRYRAENTPRRLHDKAVVAAAGLKQNDERLRYENDRVFGL